MTLDEVVQRVMEVADAVDIRDFEKAHVLEDSLHRDVLRAIASAECGHPVACAEAALTTRTYDFPRWAA